MNARARGVNPLERKPPEVIKTLTGTALTALAVVIFAQATASARGTHQLHVALAAYAKPQAWIAATAIVAIGIPALRALRRAVRDWRCQGGPR